MTHLSSHHSLDVWHRAHTFRVQIYRTTEGLAVRKNPRLVHQVRASTSSVADNVAEGKASPTRAGYCRHVGIAMASAGEADSQIIGLRDCELLAPEQAFEFLDELATIRRMLQSLHRSLRHGNKRQ